MNRVGVSWEHLRRVATKCVSWLKSKRQMEEHLRTGLWGEQVAERMLAGKGYRILGRRVRVGKRDELDLVVRDKEVLVFVEVKTRRREDYGRPIETVNRAKKKALSRAALRYMSELKAWPPYFRFDVVEVIGLEKSGNPVVRHIENAFTLDRIFKIP